jgi:hypothetical protein
MALNTTSGKKPHGVESIIGHVLGQNGGAAKLLIVKDGHHPALVGLHQTGELMLVMIEADGYGSSSGGRFT